jgi:hypothetical protein
MRTAGIVAAAVVLVASCAASGERIYDPQADAWKQLEAAATRAREGHRRVLAIIGGDW